MNNRIYSIGGYDFTIFRARWDKICTEVKQLEFVHQSRPTTITTKTRMTLARLDNVCLKFGFQPEIKFNYCFVLQKLNSWISRRSVSGKKLDFNRSSSFTFVYFPPNCLNAWHVEDYTKKRLLTVKLPIECGSKFVWICFRFHSTINAWKLRTLCPEW